jgi:hypothetical protein
MSIIHAEAYAMPLAVAIIIIFFGAILVLASVVNPRQISGEGGGFLVNMDELFRGQPGIWRIIGLVLGVVLIAGGAVGSTIQSSPDGGVVANASPVSIPTQAVALPSPTLSEEEQHPTPATTSTIVTSVQENVQSCFELPAGRTASMEAGQFDVPVIEFSKATDGPLALRLTDNRAVVGYVMFNFFPSPTNSVFKVVSIADSECRPVDSYMPVGIPGDPNTIQNWDDLCIRFSQELYSINFGWEDSPVLDLDFKKLTDRSEPTRQACASAIGRG